MTKKAPRNTKDFHNNIYRKKIMPICFFFRSHSTHLSFSQHSVWYSQEGLHHTKFCSLQICRYTHIYRNKMKENKKYSTKNIIFYYSDPTNVEKIIMLSLSHNFPLWFSKFYWLHHIWWDFNGMGQCVEYFVTIFFLPFSLYYCVVHQFLFFWINIQFSIFVIYFFILNISLNIVWDLSFIYKTKWFV